MGEMMNGKKIAKETREKLKIKCDELKEKGINPKFAAIMVGNDNASQIYIRNKSKACEEIGIEFEEYLLSEKIEQKEELNNRKDIHGILLQSPIPANLDINEAFRTIAPEKDVDGFNPLNIGKLCLNQDTFVSCTPYGIMKLFEAYGIELEGKDVTIVGRSNIVGKPLIQCCLRKNATVTVCHSKTKDLKKHTKDADVVIMAIGKSKFLKADMIKEGAVVIDVGINRDSEGKITGDADFDNILSKASFITPVPGGVGPMTIAMLMNNIIKAAEMQNK